MCRNELSLPANMLHRLRLLSVISLLLISVLVGQEINLAGRVVNANNNPEDVKPLPIPPKGWYPYNDNPLNTRSPELYVSVAGLDPRDVVGWHISNTTPDYGTPGFAYQFSSRYSVNDDMTTFNLLSGFNKNEGYDPTIAGDPGYGVLLYRQKPEIDRELVAITDIYLSSTSTDSAHQDLWAISEFNPGVNAQGGLSAFPWAPEGTVFFYEFVPHKKAQELLAQQTSNVYHVYFGTKKKGSSTK